MSSPVTVAFSCGLRAGAVAFSLVIGSACAPGGTAHRADVDLSVQAPSPAGTVVGTDSVEFVPFRDGSGRHRDCAAAPTGLCRVRYGVDASAIRALLARGTNVQRAGDVLTFMHEGAGDAVELTGGLQYPMSRVRGTDLWVISLHVPDAERAVVSYAFLSAAALRPGDRLTMAEWRGPAAPRLAPKAAALRGRVTVDTLPGAHGRPRGLVVYHPPVRGREPVVGVVYLGDGESVHGVAPYVDTLITLGRLPRVMLVGIPVAKPMAGDAPNADLRAMEYLWDFQPGNANFLALERLLVDEVIPWAERVHGAPAGRQARAVWGISNSGAWAIDMGLRNPDVIGSVLAFSPGGRRGQIADGTRLEPRVRFLLQGGTLEPGFHAIARAWSDSLGARGVQPAFREVVAGHDWLVWAEQFAEAVRWTWAGSRS